MLVYGAVLGCAGDAATLAALLGLRSPFVAPLGRRAEADTARLELFARGHSDPLTALEAYGRWRRARAAGGRHGGDRFCRAHFLSGSVLGQAEQQRGQLLGLLASIGFVPRRRGGGGGGGNAAVPGAAEEENRHAENRHAGSDALLKAVLAAGLLPGVASVDRASGTAGAAPTYRVRERRGATDAHRAAAAHRNARLGDVAEHGLRRVLIRQGREAARPH